METNEKLKATVKQKYSEIALTATLVSGSCCSSSSCCTPTASEFSKMNDDYTQITGYIPEADLGLGCGIPTEFAGIKMGDTVLDLGSGAGNDVFVARSLTGETGRVIGLDFTEAMVLKARENNQKLGFTNVEFYQGDIENMPFEDNLVDVVVSNCVLNLVPDKQKAFSEIYRVLKPGGRFCVSDIVVNAEVPAELINSAVLYAGCVSGALKTEEYLKIISASNFNNIEIKKRKKN